MTKVAPRQAGDKKEIQLKQSDDGTDRAQPQPREGREQEQEPGSNTRRNTGQKPGKQPASPHHTPLYPKHSIMLLWVGFGILFLWLLIVTILFGREQPSPPTPSATPSTSTSASHPTATTPSAAAAAAAANEGTTSKDLDASVATTTTARPTTSDVVIPGTLDVSGKVTVDTVDIVATTNSTSKVSGALVVGGGVGVSGQVTSETMETVAGLVVGDGVTINGGAIDMSGANANTFKLKAAEAAALTFQHGTTAVLKLDTTNTASSTETTGSVVVTGGVGVSGQVSARTMRTFATTASSSTTTGSLIVDGGVGVGGQVTAETMEAVAGLTVGGDVAINGGIIDLSGTNANTFKLKASEAAALTFKHGTTAVLKLDTTNTASSTKTSGAVIVTGGVGVSGQVTAETMETVAGLTVGDGVTINGGAIDMSGTNANSFNLAASQAAALTFKHGTTTVMKLDTTGTASTTATTGSVRVTGGLGISEQMTAKRLAVAKTQVQVTGSTNKAITMSTASSFIELTADASADANSVTMGAGSDGQLAVVKNSDGQTARVNSVDILAGEARMFVYDSTSATWAPMETSSMASNVTNLGKAQSVVNLGKAQSVVVTSASVAIDGIGQTSVAVVTPTGIVGFGTAALVALDQNTGDSYFGHSVAMTDNWAIVGTFGAKKAFIFKNTAGTWGTTAVFALDQNTGDSYFGFSVAMTDNWAMVGAYDAKKAFVFPGYGQLNTITGATAGDVLVLSVSSGKSLALSSGGNIKMGSKNIALNGNSGDTVSLLYDGTVWLITSKSING